MKPNAKAVVHSWSQKSPCVLDTLSSPLTRNNPQVRMRLQSRAKRMDGGYAEHKRPKLREIGDGR